MPCGYLILLLHAHLPFVRHPEHSEFLEENWLFEAITETYIPLLRMFERLAEERVPFHMVMTLSPTLCEMLADPHLQSRYLRYIERLLELAEREVADRAADPRFAGTARMYRVQFRTARDFFEHRGRNLLPSFRALQEAGLLEIVTCAATHGFLPLMRGREAVRAQTRAAVANYRKHFGCPPRGIWLPECGYSMEVGEEIRACGLEFSFVDTHAVMNGSRVSKYGVYAPIRTPAGLALFARDLETSKQVWSSHEGYPGDPVYREFYRDLGYDADYDYIRPYLHPDGVRRHVGIKYHRVTGQIPLHEKQTYNPSLARDRAAVHAGNFLFNRQHQVRILASAMDLPPVVLSPYDAELFGHWWFEGPQFLEFVIRKMAFDQDDVRLVSTSSYLELLPRTQVLEPSESTWGNKGYHEMWLNPANDWIYAHLHVAEERMVALVRRHPHADGVVRRALTQAARELLLAQASDWAFIMSVGGAVPYAHRRFKEHIQRFTRLWEQVEVGRIDESALSEWESHDSIFPELDYRCFS